MKIATLTLNPAVDRTMYFGRNIKLGALNRAVDKSVTTHGGKGTNVSCMFKILGAESVAYGFTGGGNGDLFVKLLEPYNIKTDFTRTKCDTRLNFKIISSDGESTEFNESGGPVGITEKKEILNKIKKCVGRGDPDAPQSENEADFFFMGGSVPPGIEKSIYRDIINLGGGRTKFIIDCDGEALKLCMDNEKKPYLIKPNQFEFEQYTGKKFDLDNNFDAELEKIKEEAKKIYEKTGVIILCTLGEYGGLYCGSEGIYYIKSPKVEVKGFTGAGDTFLTAFVAAYFGMFDVVSVGAGFHARPQISKSIKSTTERHGNRSLQQGLSAQKSLAFAVAASTAKVTKPGTEFASVGEMTAMYERILEKNNI